MNLSNKITFLGILLSVSTLTSTLEAQASSQSPDSTIESRLSRLTEIMKQRGVDLDEMSPFIEDESLLSVWANGRGGTWVNTRLGGFGDHNRGGGFINRSPWRDGGYRRWGDGGRFYNRGRWPNGSGFLNRW